MKHYTQPFLPECEVAVPVLHRVYFNSDQEHEVREWLKDKCQDKYYTTPDWAGCFVEFEDDEDASIFALRWG